jgi:hypothetical protein
MRPVVAFAKIPLAPEAFEDRLDRLLGGKRVVSMS